MLIARILLTTISVFLYLFLFWKKLKEDYTQNQIFTTAFFSLFGILSFSLFSAYYLQGYEFYMGAVGSFLGLLMGVSKYKLRFFEALEAFVIANLGIDILYSIFNLFASLSIKNTAIVTVSTLMFVAFFLTDKHYKKFRWYRSGKVGFTGLFIAGIFFTLRSLIDIILPGVLFFGSRSEALIFGSLAFLSFIALYNLSQKQI